MERANELFLDIHDAFKKKHSRKLNIKINNGYYSHQKVDIYMHRIFGNNLSTVNYRLN